MHAQGQELTMPAIRSAAVVGGARGIGLSIAEALGAAPWVSEVVIGDVDAQLVTQAVESLSRLGLNARGAQIDVGDDDSIRQFAEEAGQVEYLAVAAGVFDSGNSLDFERAAFERVLAINATGTFFCGQHFARDMVARGSGAILGVTSIAARMPRYKQAAYSASKAAMRQAYRVLGMEIAGDGVRVNTISPGPTDTEMMRRMAKDHSSMDDLAEGSPEAMRPRIPRGVIARPEDIAAAAVFLLSPAAAHITLQDLVVDGGELLGM